MVFAPVFRFPSRSPSARRVVAAGLLAAVLGLSGCATLTTPPVSPGDSEQQVVARLGKPTDVYPDGNTRLLEYNAGPFGQFTYMARIGPDGRLISYEQVWTLQSFYKIKIGETTKDQILRLLGRPTEIVRYARVPYEAWNYGYKESNVWNSEMSIYFDDAGIVRKTENGPDPRFDHDRSPF